MNFYCRINEAIDNLFAARLRSILALLGILIGTASVVAMVSGGQLAAGRALEEIKNLGTDLLTVAFKSVKETSPGKEEDKVPLATILAMKKNVKEIIKAAPYTEVYDSIYFKGQSLNGEVVGTTSDFMDISKLTLKSGRFVSLLDKYAYFCTVGANVYQQISQYSSTNPIGQQIKIGNSLFTIVGIIKPTSQNAFIDTSIDNNIFIPIQTSFLLSKYAQINETIMQLAPNIKPDAAQSAVTQFFINNLSNKKLIYQNSKQLIESMQRQQKIFSSLLGFIGGISLLVGGIGVMNIMLVAVNERRKEIGIRRAIGAKRRDIQWLFLTESAFLALVGGFIGVFIGVLSSWIIAEVRHWQFHFLFYPPLLGFSVSLLTGIFFGIYPAYKASILNPIETLHAE